jgi:hypothetical protein
MDIQTLLDNKLTISLVSAVVGGVATRVFSVMKGRVQELEYTVKHDRVGLSVDDDIFGSVKATWQGHELTNLYSSTVTIANTTTRDFKNVVIKVYTGDTLLLSERVEIQGSTYIPVHTEGFKKTTHIEPGEQPTDRQIYLYRHTREYDVVVLNRGQKVIFHYLTTERNPNNTPSVWVDIQQEGLRATYKLIAPEVHGVPVKTAIPIGLIACIGILAGVAYLNPPVWLAAICTLLAGLIAQSIGAWLYKSMRAIIRFFSQ